MAYPNNSFEQFLLEIDQYGGANAGKMDQDAWTFLTGLVRSVCKVVLAYVVPLTYAPATVLVQESVAIGDVLAIDVSTDAVDPITQQPVAFIGKFSTITTNGGTPKVCGIVTIAAALGTKATIAVGGIVPRSVTGLAAIAAGSLLAVDATTSRLRAWVGGDDGLGYSSPSGNALWLYSGRLAT